MRKTIKRDIEPLSVNQSSNFYLLICQRILDVRNVLKIYVRKQTKPIKKLMSFVSSLIWSYQSKIKGHLKDIMMKETTG